MNVITESFLSNLVSKEQVSTETPLSTKDIHCLWLLYSYYFSRMESGNPIGFEGWSTITWEDLDDFDTLYGSYLQHKTIDDVDSIIFPLAPSPNITVTTSSSGTCHHNSLVDSQD